MPTSPDTAYPSAKTDRQAVCDEWTRFIDKHDPRWHQALRDLLPLRTLV